MEFQSPTWSNCFFWALGQFFKKGGYVAFRKSKHGPIPHFLWSKNLKHWWGYTPVITYHVHLLNPWKWIMFKGKIKEEKI